MRTEALVKRQRSFFDSRETIAVSCRIRALDALETAIKKYESELAGALRKDLGKSRAEA